MFLILKVVDEELSVNCTDKFTGDADALSTCICLTKHLAEDGDVNTVVVSVVLKLIPAFLYCCHDINQLKLIVRF